MASSRKSVSGALRDVLAPLGAVSPARPLAIAFSGGLDSTVLLHAAADVVDPRALLALHVDHGLQAASRDWAGHCARVADALSVRFAALRAEGAPAPGDSVEAWARAQRYRLLLAAARREGAAALATAHHADDQLETVLLALARGCGLDGLTGIAAADRRAGVLLLRPLLGLERADLHAWARHRSLAWIDDPSNLDPALARNALRARAVPALVDALPGVAARAARTLGLLAQARATLDELAAADLASVSLPGALDRAALARLSPGRRAGVLRAWLAALGARPPSLRKLDELRAQLVDGRGAAGDVVHDGWRLTRHRDRIAATAIGAADRPVGPGDPRARPPAGFDMAWDGSPRMELAGFGGWLRFDAAGAGEEGALPAAALRATPLRIEPGRPAARLRLRPGGPSRTLKNLYQEHEVPAWLRPWLPMASLDRVLVYAAPFGMAAVPPRGESAAARADHVVLRWEPASADDPRAPFCAVQKV